MRLVAIYSVWSDYDWLEHSIENISPFVAGVIVIASENSNYGEYCRVPDYWRNKVVIWEPKTGAPAMRNETDKRNFGLAVAMQSNYSHFVMLDSDELYDPIEFRKAKDYLNSKPNLNGLVCKSQVYVKEPTLTIGLDTTLVPFIHKITPDLKHEFNRKYPFAWEGNKIRIDPTRSMNINSGVEMVDVTMHHMSYIRTDIRRKIRNSTARNNLEKSTILEDYKNAKPGYFFKFYGKELYQVENKFNIPPMIDLSV